MTHELHHGSADLLDTLSLALMTTHQLYFHLINPIAHKLCRISIPKRDVILTHVRIY